MKKLIAVMVILLSMASEVRAVPWNYQNDEWPIPSDIRTEKDYKEYIAARHWYLAAGVALVAGCYIANMNAHGLYRKAGHIQTLLPAQTRTNSDGSLSVYFPVNQGALESRGRIRGKADAYRKGAIIGAMLAVVCFQVSYSLRF